MVHHVRTFQENVTSQTSLKSLHRTGRVQQFVLQVTPHVVHLLGSCIFEQKITTTEAAGNVCGTVVVDEVMLQLSFLRELLNALRAAVFLGQTMLHRNMHRHCTTLFGCKVAIVAAFHHSYQILFCYSSSVTLIFCGQYSFLL